MDRRERRIQAGVKVLDDWVRSDPRGYIKADDREVVSRIIDAIDAVEDE